MLRIATEADLRIVASWISSREELEFWAGDMVPYPIQMEDLPKLIHLSPDTSFVLDNVVAFGQLFDQGEGRGHLGRIIVSPKLRRTGRGLDLVRALTNVAAERGLDRVGLNVQEANLAAISLYEKLGFKVTQRPAAQRAAAGALYMSCNLTAAEADCRGQSASSETSSRRR
jgi:ribosomal protein S18 acetylase RimI-like enzyme